MTKIGQGGVSDDLVMEKGIRTGVHSKGDH